PTVEQTPEVANAHRKAEAGMKAEHSGRASSESRIMADASARVAEPQFKKRQHGAVLGGLVGGSLPRTVPAPNTLDGFTASNAVAPAPPAPAPAPADAKASTFSDITAAPRVAAANAPATPDQLARESRSNAQKDIGGTAGRVD